MFRGFRVFRGPTVLSRRSRGRAVRTSSRLHGFSCRHRIREFITKVAIRASRPLTEGVRKAIAPFASSAERDPSGSSADRRHCRHQYVGRLRQRGDQREEIQAVPGNYGHFYLEVAGALEGKNPMPVSRDQILAVASIIDKAREISVR